MVTDAERLGMLGRRANRRSTEQRYHPLVREFLEDRLRPRDRRQPASTSSTSRSAAWAEPSDWRTAAHHYAASGRWPDLQRVLEAHLADDRRVGRLLDGRGLRAPVSRGAAVGRCRGRPLPRGQRSRATSSKLSTMLGAPWNCDPDNDMVMSSIIGDAASCLGTSQRRQSLRIIRPQSLVSVMRRPLPRRQQLAIASSIDGDLTEAARISRNLAETMPN